MSIEQSLSDFIHWWREHITGDEKGEAQVFLDHLMRAFGHEGALEAGGTYESRIRRRRNGKTTVAFADYLIPKRVLIEMKKRGEALDRHYTQLEDYWKRLDDAVRPRYALLCNFDEFWIYDFHRQYFDPVDIVPLVDLSERRLALEFMVKGSSFTPVFKGDRVQVTEEAAEKLSMLYRSLERDVKQEIALRFTLQCMTTFFAQDTGLLPTDTLGRVFARVEPM